MDGSTDRPVARSECLVTATARSNDGGSFWGPGQFGRFPAVLGGQAAFGVDWREVRIEIE